MSELNLSKLLGDAMEPPETILNSSQNILQGPEEDAEEQHEDEHMSLRVEMIQGLELKEHHARS